MNKKIMSIAIIGLIGVSLLSTGLVKNNVFASTNGNKRKVEFSKEENDNLNLTNVKVKLTKDDVVKLVLNKYKEGKVEKVKLDDEEGNIVYEVDMILNGVEYDIDIDASNGNILKDEVDDYDHDSTKPRKEDDEDKEQASLKQLAKITLDQAKSIVMDKYKDGVITEVDLDNEDGNIVYEVEVNAKDGVHDIEVDAVNGKILVDELDD